MKKKIATLSNFFVNKGWLIIIFLLLIIASFIRVYKLESVPVSPYWEEVALGYDAYSVYMTGKDHHGNAWPIVAFESFGDWKPALYFYAIIPFILVFDLSVLSVRLPAAISGIIIVALIGLLTYRLANQIWETEEKSKTKVWSKISSVIAVFIATFSPWLTLFSRAGWEVNLGTALLLGGFTSGLFVVPQPKNQKVVNLNIIALAICVLLLSLATYAYHGTRFMAPFVGVFLVGWWIYLLLSKHSASSIFSLLRSQMIPLTVIGLISTFLLFPIIASLGSKQIEQRFFETTIFSNLEPVTRSNALREMHGNSLISRIAYHRYIFHSEAFLENLSKHLSLDFLFLSGDSNPRHSVQIVGHLYLIELLPLIVGMFIFFTRAKKTRHLFGLFMFIALIPASISLAAPHALRTLPLAPLLLVLVALGWTELLRIGVAVRARRTDLNLISAGVVLGIVLAGYTFLIIQFMHYYWVIYPYRQAHEWQDGYQQTIEIIEKVQAAYSESSTVISREYGRPAMYYWFYTKADPLEVQEESRNAESKYKDQSELLKYQNTYFIKKYDTLTSEPIPFDELIKSTHLIVAGSEAFITHISSQLQQNNVPFELTSQEQVIDARGEEVWNISVFSLESESGT